MRTRTRRRSRRALMLVLAAALALPVLPTGAAETGNGKVTVVHAVPDLTVDVYANGGMLLEDFAPGTITGVVKLAPGSYDVEVKPANSDTVALAATLPVSEKTDAAAVAYLDEAGNPTLGTFRNRQSPIRRRWSRVTVRHTAAAPAVDVRYKRPGGNWRMVATELANGEQAVRALRARTYRFDVVLAGTKTRVLGPAKLSLSRRTHYFVYAWGSAAADNLALNLSTRRLPVR